MKARGVVNAVLALALATFPVAARAGGGDHDHPDHPDKDQGVPRGYDQPGFNENEKSQLDKLDKEERDANPSPTPADRDHGGNDNSGGGSDKSDHEGGRDHDPTEHDHPDRPDRN